MDLNFPVFATGVRIFWASNDVGSLRAPDKLRICVFYAMKTSKNACIIRSECTHYAYILLCKAKKKYMCLLSHVKKI